MGYSGSNSKGYEFADKTTHSEIIKDPELQEFLEECFIPQQAPEDIEDYNHLVINYQPADTSEIKYVVAIDGGLSIVPAREKYPSSEIAILQFGALFLDLTKIKEIEHKKFISPSDIKRLKHVGKSKLYLPVKNLMNGKFATFSEFVRNTIYKFYNQNFNLAGTLKWLIFREFLENPFEFWTLAQDPYTKEKVNLDRKSFDRDFITHRNDKEKIYITDVLRLHELIDENIGAKGIISYLLAATEQLIMISIIRYILEKNPSTLKNFLFILDRPLAFQGQTANIHKPVRELINFITNKYQLNIVGLEKSGAFVEHAKALQRAKLLEKGQILILSNDYIYKNIVPRNVRSDNIYGQTTYYGGKLIFYTREGNTNICTIPVRNYEEALKNPTPDKFYNLFLILNILEKLKCDMYEDAILPISLINSAVSISKYPGEISLERFIKNVLSN